MPLHIAVKGGKKHLPFAKKKLKELKRSLGSPKSFTKVYEMSDGARVIVRKVNLNEYIIINGGRDVYVRGIKTDNAKIAFFNGNTKGGKFKIIDQSSVLPIGGGLTWDPQHLYVLNGFSNYLGESISVQYIFEDFQKNNGLRTYPTTDSNGYIAINFQKNLKLVSGILVEVGFPAEGKFLRVNIQTFPFGYLNGKMHYGTLYGRWDSKFEGLDHSLIIFNDEFKVVTTRAILQFPGYQTYYPTDVTVLGNGEAMYVMIPMPKKNTITSNPPTPMIVRTQDFGATWTYYGFDYFRELNTEGKYVSKLASGVFDGLPKTIYAGNKSVFIFYKNNLGRNVALKSIDNGFTFEEIAFPLSSSTVTLTTRVQGIGFQNLCFGDGCFFLPYFTSSMSSGYSAIYTKDYGKTWTIVSNVPSDIVLLWAYPVQTYLKTSEETIEAQFIAIRKGQPQEDGSISPRSLVISKDYFSTWEKIADIPGLSHDSGDFGDMGSDLSQIGKDIPYYKAFPNLFV